MRLGIVSDTHGELDNLHKAAQKLIDRWQADTIVHLGDEWEDVETIKDLPFKKIIRIPGVYCEQYRDPAIENRLLMNIEDIRFLFTHTDKVHQNDLPGDPDPEELAARQMIDVICYGHTHIPDIRQENNVLRLNPGHLKNHDKKGCSPSFAVVEIQGRKLHLYLIDLETDQILREAELHLDQS